MGSQTGESEQVEVELNVDVNVEPPRVLESVEPLINMNDLPVYKRGDTTQDKIFERWNTETEISKDNKPNKRKCDGLRNMCSNSGYG